MVKQQINLKESLKKLAEIVEWFEGREEIDVETGLKKVKGGAALVKACKGRLGEIENEFNKIRRDIEDDEEEEEEEDEKDDAKESGEVAVEDLPF